MTIGAAIGFITELIPDLQRMRARLRRAVVTAISFGADSGRRRRWWLVRRQRQAMAHICSHAEELRVSTGPCPLNPRRYELQMGERPTVYGAINGRWTSGSTGGTRQ